MNRYLQIFLLTICASTALLFTLPAQGDDVARIEISSAALAWQPTTSETTGLQLVVTGPEGVRIT